MKTFDENKIRVLVVDDSLISRKLHQKIIGDDPRFEVVDTARNGEEAFAKVQKLAPHVVSMDVNMPNLNGIDATRKIMNHCPVPIVIVSSLYNEKEKKLAVDAAAAGAVHIMPKPHGILHPDFGKDSRKYLRMLNNMSKVKVVSRRNQIASLQVNQNTYPNSESINKEKRDIVLIGASAGGPQALRTILMALPAQFPLPVLIVQHLDKSFTESFRSWLASFSSLPVSIAQDNEIIKGGHIYLAQGGRNMVLKSRNTIMLSDMPQGSGQKPSVAALFHSAGPLYRKNAVAILLSGMGKDGAEDMLDIKRYGAFTIAQDKQSCLVFGMPGEAVKLNAAMAIFSPEKIAKELIKLINQ